MSYLRAAPAKPRPKNCVWFDRASFSFAFYAAFAILGETAFADFAVLASTRAA